MSFKIADTPTHRILFFATWLLFALMQSALMPLSGEEAYYWLFSRALDWGYLDHPPAVAFFGRLGYELLENELGVRLFSSLLSVSTLWLIYDLIGRKGLRNFVFLAGGLLAVHAGSFLVKTDVPLLFFEVLFFWFYKRFLDRSNIWNSLGIAFAIAGMFLSKYHGILVVLFTLLSNWRLIKNQYFWVAVLFTVILMLPHLFWLIENDFSSLRFHLNGRSDISFKWSNVLGYVGSQPLVLGPLVSLPMLYALFRRKYTDAFSRALLFVLLGVLIFFFFQSFRVFIHKHWTSIVLVPLIILAFPVVETRQKLAVVFRRLARVSLLLLVLFRVYLIYDFVPKSLPIKTEPLHDWKAWAQNVQELSKGMNVVFINSYENASRYQFYTGEPAHTLSTYYFNNTQFDYWGYEDYFRGEPVIVIHNKRGQDFYQTVDAPNGAQIHFRRFRQFNALDKIQVTPVTLELSEDKTQVVGKIKIENPYDFDIRSSRREPVQLLLYSLKGERVLAERVLLSDLNIASKGALILNFEVVLPEIQPDTQLRFSVSSGNLPGTINSERIKV